jgi:hypothetical protein
MKIETRNLEDLTIHPVVKNLARLSDDEMLGWRRSLKWLGEENVPPIFITAENKIVDGRHRYWCARKLGWKTIPVAVVADNEIGKIVVGSLAARRAYSKAQIVFILAEFVDPALNRAAQLAGLKIGKNANVSPLRTDSQRGLLSTSELAEIGKNANVSPLRTDSQPWLLSTSELAEIIGVSCRIVGQALEVRELFKADQTRRTMTDRNGVVEKDVTFEEFFTPRIIRSEDPEAPRTRAYGLGAVLAGAKAIIQMEHRADVRPHGGGRTEKIGRQLELFNDALHDFQNKFIYWEKWDADARTEAVKAFEPVVEHMPKDLLTALAKKITAELKRREK